MTDKQPLSIHFPGRLIFGNGCLSGLPHEIIKSGSKKILILTIEPLLTALDGLILNLKANGIAVLIDISIVQEPTFRDFEKLMKIAKEVGILMLY
jgi:alcohol dehydrogenase class IV